MNGIDLMVEEHLLIKRMLQIMRKACYRAVETGGINYEDFAEMIDFVRAYADHHHHGKEENYLFDAMVKHAGPAAEKLVTHGMLVEHDLGRLHMSQLDVALLAYKAGNKEAILDIVANAISYTHLLNRHIDKEDTVVYPFAQRTLKPSILDAIDRDCESFEQEQTAKGIQKKYTEMVEKFEAKYL